MLLASPHGSRFMNGPGLRAGCSVAAAARPPVPRAGAHLLRTCSAIGPRVHDDELGPQLADAPPLEDGHEPAQVLQVEGVAGAAHLRVVLRALHGAVQALAAG